MTQNFRRAIVFALGAALSFACTGASIKFASAELNNGMTVFLRCLFGFALLLPWVVRKPVAQLKTQRLGMHILRASIGMCAMYCFFYAIAHIRLAEAMLLTYCAPLYVPLIAWFWLGERPKAIIIPIVVSGFLGVSLILQGQFTQLDNLAGIVAWLAGVFAAFAFVAIRRLSRTEPTLRVVFYFTGLSLLVSSASLPWFWQTPSLSALLLMILAGACANTGQFCLTKAYSLAPAAQIAPLNYLVVLFSALIAGLLWNEWMDALGWIGTLLVISSSLAASRFRTVRS